MTAMHSIQPAMAGHGDVATEAEGQVVPSPEIADEGQIQRVEDQLAVMLNAAEKIAEDARKLQEESHGEAMNQVAQARQQAMDMCTTAEKAKNEINAARRQSGNGKCHLSTRKLAAISGEINHVMRAADHEKVALGEAVAETRAHNATSKAASEKGESKIVPSLARTVRRVTHASTAAVVGPPVFVATPGDWFSRSVRSTSHTLSGVGDQVSQAWQRATQSVAEMTQAVTHSEPVMRLRTWGAEVSHVVGEFVESRIQTTKKAAQKVAAKATQLADDYIATPLANAAESVTQKAKQAYRAAGAAKDSALDYANSTFEKAKQLASHVWPFGGQPTPTSNVAKAVAVPEKPSSISAMAQALKQAATCALPLGLACQPASTALSLVPSVSPPMFSFSQLSSSIGL